MSGGPARIAIFDCDGTLIDGQASICAAMEAAFGEAGLAAPDRNRVRRIVGLSLPQAIARLAPDADEETHAAAVAAYKRAFQSARQRGDLQQPLFAGIADLIASLDDAGWTLGVATGMSRRGLDHVLAMHGLTRRFATLQTADDHPSKPDPAMLLAALADVGGDADAAVMIGDTAYDMHMARDAGVRAIGVAWGAHDADELRAAGAAFIAVNPAELGDYLRR